MNQLAIACLGLFVAWAAHDVEELVTMSDSSRKVWARVPRSVPVPTQLRERGFSQAHVNLTLAMMAGVVGVASLAGVRTAGKSPLFRGALLAYGAHGFLHLAGAASARGYVTGVATSPTFVIAYWVWARRVLRAHGIKDIDRQAVAIALVAFPLVFIVHGASWVILGGRALGSTLAGA